MAKGKSTEAEAQVLPSEGEVTPETALPEQVEATPEAGTLEPTAQELDLKARLQTLAKEERDALHEEVWPGLRESDKAWGRTEGEKNAVARVYAEQQRQAQANQELQDTLRNLDTETDDNRRAGHIWALVQKQTQNTAEMVAQAELETARESFGLSPEEHRRIVRAVKEQAFDNGRIATFGDYVKAVTGERYVTKQEAGKLSRAEMDAYFEEKMGLKRDQEAAPVSVGQGQPMRSTADDVANAQGQEAKRIAFEKRHGFKPL